MELNNLINKNIAILWFWREGKSTLKFLKKIWVDNITILDKNKISSDYIEWNINIITWENYLDNLLEYDFIFKTPWISPYNKLLINYKDKFISWAELFFDNYKWKTICITWTKWKSTTSTLIYKTLKELGLNVKLVWNIWVPVLDEIDLITWETYDYIVYEMSSYMLETLKPKSYISIINNIYNCHFDWHDWKNNYQNAKKNILRNAENKIINYELRDLIIQNDLIYFGTKWTYTFNNGEFLINDKCILLDENILLAWIHNRYNISAVIWVLDIIHKDKSYKNLYTGLKNVLKTFSWLPHRIENIWTKNWITFIDDAIATTPESTIAAIKTFWKDIWTIFIWWQDSGFDFTELRETIMKYNIQNIVIFPDTWNMLFWDFTKNLNFDTISRLDWAYSPKILKTNTMKKAVKFAFENTENQKICILSCASPSFSLWKWFEDKWDQFKNEIEKY